MRCFVLDIELGDLYEEHHVIKKEHGGEKLQTVYLSSSIHDALHRSSNTIILEQILSKLTPKQTKKFLFLKRCLDIKVSEKVKIKITFELDKSNYDKLKCIANDHGLSVNNFIKKAIESRL